MKLKKILISFILSVVAIFVIGVNFIKVQAEATASIYYVNAESGNDSNDGTIEKPFKTVTTAVKAPGSDLEIHLLGNKSCGNTANKNFGTGKNSITIIGDKENSGSVFKLQSTFESSTNLTFKNVTFEGNNGIVQFYCNGYDLTIDENCKTDVNTFGVGDTNNQGIEFGPSFQIFAGGLGSSSTPEVKPSNLKDDSKYGYFENTITILSGDYGKIVQANRTCNTGTKDNHVKTNIVFGGTAYTSLIVGSNDWRAYNDGHVTVMDDARVYRIIGGSLGYEYSEKAPTKVYEQYGSNTIDIKGGHIKKIIGGSYGRGTGKVLMDGDVNINVSRGHIEKILGGSASGNTKGNISINITGGEFGPILEEEGIVFGTSKKKCTEYSTKDQCGIYGGGAGRSDMATNDQIYEYSYVNEANEKTVGEVTGNVITTITGGTFNCNIYGGGEGVDYHHATYTNTKYNNNTELFNVAQIKNGVTLKVSGCTVYGNIYGGGKGFETPAECTHETKDLYPLIGKISPFIKLEVGSLDDSTIVNGTIYGGGIYPHIVGDDTGNVIDINVSNTTVNSKNGIALYGGSEKSDVEGKIGITVDNNSILNGSIYIGSGTGDINGDIDLNIKDSEIYGDLNLGSQDGEITGDIIVNIKGIAVIDDIVIGSETGEIDGAVDVKIDDTVVKGSIIVGTENDKFDEGITVTIINTTVEEDIINNTDSEADINIDDNSSINGVEHNPVVLKVKNINWSKNEYDTHDTVVFEATYISGFEDTDFTYSWYKVIGDRKVLIPNANTLKLILDKNDIDSFDCGYYCVINNGEKDLFKSNTAYLHVRNVGVSVTFDANPTINFYVEVGNDYDSNSSAIIKIGDRKVKVIGIEDKNSSNTYIFSVVIAPYELASVINIRIPSESIDLDYSAITYCETILNGDYNDELKAVIKTLVNYGEYSKEYFDPEDATVINSILDDADRVVSSEMEEVVPTFNVTSTDITPYSATVEILDTVTIRVFVSVNKGKSIDGYTVTVDGNPYTIKTRGTLYFVEISGINATELSKVYDVKFIKGSSICEIKYSAMCYCYAMSNESNPKVKNFVMAMYDYSNAAIIYKEANK